SARGAVVSVRWVPAVRGWLPLGSIPAAPTAGWCPSRAGPDEGGRRAPSALGAGIAPELYDNVASYAIYPRHTPRQRLAIEYAERFATDHASIDDAFFARLRQLFTDEEILDLTLCVAVFLGLGRSLTVLGVDQSCASDV
ncbi:MAG TPA: hypothetical protein VE197_20155, partial [Mycobacterium sp.]|nr:hypothetical protein [Mycobacterium sp.]